MTFYKNVFIGVFGNFSFNQTDLLNISIKTFFNIYRCLYRQNERMFCHVSAGFLSTKQETNVDSMSKDMQFVS